MNTTDRIEIIKQLLPDKNLCNIIFNYEEKPHERQNGFISNEKKCISYFSNILAFTSLVVLNRFFEWKKSCKDDLGNASNSFWRIYNMLDKVYDPTKVNGDFVDDLILNLEIDWYLTDHESDQYSFVSKLGIEEMFNFKKQSKLSKYIYSLKQKRISSRYNPNFNFEDLCDCIRMFPYLTQATARLTEMGVSNQGKIDNNYKNVLLDFSKMATSFPFKTIDLWYSVCVYDSSRMSYVYYVADIYVDDPRRFDSNKNKAQSIMLNYVPISASKDNFKVLLSNESLNSLDKNDPDTFELVNDSIVERFFLNYDIVNFTPLNVDSVFFRDYILLNNRYLKEVSLTVVDSLTPEAKAAINRKYSNKYQSVFDKMKVASFYNDADVCSYRWDEIALFLLMEEGVYEFFRFLLSIIDFKSFLDSFSRRFGADNVKRIRNQEMLINDPESNLPFNASSSTRNDNKAAALVSLASKLLTANTYSSDASLSTPTIDDLINECIEINKKTNYTDRNKTVYMINMLTRISSFMHRFYQGVFKYAQNRKMAVLSFEASEESFYKKYKKYNHEKSLWLNPKITREKNDIKKIFTFSKKTDAIQLVKTAFKTLIDFNDRFKYNTSDGEIMFDALGKHNLFNSKIMQGYCDRLVQILESNEELNASKKFYQTFKDYLYYLKTGLEEKDRENRPSVNIENAIYPIIGQYRSGVTSRDGYRYSYFKVVSLSFDEFNNSVETNIKIIADDEFDFGCSYFCIPNINRVASYKLNGLCERIWVSPIIIPCSLYQHKMMSKIETLDAEEDFDTAIELIYNSDNYVYSRLFGSLNNAKKVMPTLLNDTNSKFYKGHYYIFRDKKQIVAIAAMYNANDCDWNKESVRSAFIENDIELPTTFDEAVTLVEEIFKEFLGGYCRIDDLCVKPEYRNHGIGKAMMVNLVKKAESNGTPPILTVYSENISAYELYCSIGFVPIPKENITPNEIDGKRHIRMVKL